MNRILLLAITLYLSVQTTFSKNCIQGEVTDPDDKAVSFASVQDVNGAYTICDSAGHFEICFNGDSAKIRIYALGFYADTVRIRKEDKEIRVILKRKDTALTEVSIVHRQTVKSTSMVSAISTGKKEIEMLNPQNIAEILQAQTGFTNRPGYQTPLTLRGLSGKRLLVLRNGLRRFSSYPAGYMSHTINVYDLERIDVEKGAASVVYGAGAMAGIVNLIDKSPFGQKGANARLTTGYGTINKEKTLLAGCGWSNGKLAFKTNLRYRTAENFKYPDGSIAENSFYTDKDVFTAIGYKFSEKQEILLTTDIHNGGPWGKPVGFNGSDYMRVQTSNENSYNYSLQYKLNTGKVLQSTELSTFYSNESRTLVKNYYTAAGYMLSYVETTRFSNYCYGVQIKNKVKISKNNLMNVGAEFYGFHISTPTDAVDYIEGISFQNRVSQNARSYLSGMYLEHIFLPGKKFKFAGGLRYDRASVYEGDVYSNTQNEEKHENKNAISGNVAALWRLKDSRIKINTARSFRMPETTELYADSYTSNGIVYANPELEPEYCHSFDVSYTYEKSFFDAEFSPFIWFVDNMISREEIKGMPGTNYQFTNLEKCRIWGGELSANLWLKNTIMGKDRLSASIGAAYLNGTDIGANAGLWAKGVPMDYVPPFNLKSNVVYNSPEDKKTELNVAIRATYYSRQTRLGESKYATPAYTFIGCSAGLSIKRFKTRPSLNIAVNNLLNTEYYSFLSYLPGEGRDVRIFLTIHFN